MIKQCVCNLCGKKFNNKDYINYERECFKHEVIEHLNGDRKCKGIIKDAINDLNQKYKLNFSMEGYSFNPIYKDDFSLYENEIIISFDLKTSIKKLIELRITCKDNNIDLTKGRIKSIIEKHYIKESQNKIIGKVKYEGWCGGLGADDYLINEIYLRDIMKNLIGKTVSIQILND